MSDSIEDMLRQSVANWEAEIERLHQTIAWWAGEGRDDTRHPEKNEYLKLCELPADQRTNDQTARLRELAQLMNDTAQMSEYSMVREIERLQAEIASYKNDQVLHSDTRTATFEEAAKDAEVGCLCGPTGPCGVCLACLIAAKIRVRAEKAS